MLLLSIPSILLLIYQSCLVKLKPYYIYLVVVWCLCWFMSLQMIHWKRHLTQNDRSTFPHFPLSLPFLLLHNNTFWYNNIIMVHLFSLLFMQTCPSVVVLQTLNRPLFMLTCPLAYVFSWATVTLIPFWLFRSYSFHFEKDFRG